ncbi:hypothetical protein GCM10022198_06940 [Klugiella xanthotipulae]|uniref:Ig-like protein group 1 n=1 Tax=Klugiella xanthotipulae TaxID=244735 RepID=A0A543HT62_9MICO|nr:Ig-like domain-containing protein [Klugiella xanthotipulae]TQM61541.1 Ig-like protein group 1 [Klugiella xanthotipulae]
MTHALRAVRPTLRSYVLMRATTALLLICAVIAGGAVIAARPAVAAVPISVSPVSAAATITTAPSVPAVPSLGAAGTSRLTVTAYPREANGADSQLAWARVTDAAGRPIENVSVAFSGESTALVLSAPTALSDGEGYAVIGVTASVAGSYAVHASVAGIALAQSPATATFAPVSVSVAHSTWRLSGAESVVADGESHRVVRVEARDQRGEPRVGAKVSVDYGVGEHPGLVVPDPVRTDEYGVATLSITATQAVSASLRVVVDGVPLSGRQQLEFSENGVGVPSAATSTWQIRADQPVTANGRDYYSSVMTIRDVEGTPVPGVMTHYSVEAAEAIAPGSAVTDADGRAVISLSASAAGLAALRADVGGWSFAPTVVGFAAAAPVPLLAAGATELSVTRGSRVADGVQEHTASVVVRDAEGRPVPEADVYFRLGADLTATSPVSVATGTDGVARVGLTATTAGRSEVTATVNGQPVPPAEGSSGRIDFVAGSPSLGVEGRTALSLAGGDRAADGLDSHLLLVTVQDAQGNPVADTPVSFRADAGVDLSGRTAITDRGGIAAVTATSVFIGRFRVSATVGGQAVQGGEQTVEFAAGAPVVGTGSHSSVGASSASSDPDGVAQQAAWAIIRDAAGHPVPGALVSFAVGGDASLTAASVVTDAEGVARVGVTSTRPGAVEVTASLAGQPVADQPVRVSFTQGSPSARGSSWVVGSSAEVVRADGASAYTAVVTVRDANGDPAPRVPVDIRVPDAVVADSPVALSDADGRAEFHLVSTVAGTFSVIAAIGGDPVGEPAALRFAVGQPSLGVEGSSELWVTDGTAVAGIGTQQAAVTVKDDHGNPLADVPVMFAADAGIELTASSVTTDADGVARVAAAAARPGEYTIRASVRVNDQVQSVGAGSRPLVYRSAGPSADASTLSVHGARSTLADGVAQASATVTVRDHDGQPVADATVDLQASEHLVLSSGPYVTDANGVLTVTATSRVAGSSELTALVGGQPIGMPQKLTYVAGEASSVTSEMTSSRLTIASDGSDSAELMVTLRDAVGNLTDDRGSVQILSSGGVVTPTITEDGIARATVSSVRPGVIEASFLLDGAASSAVTSVTCADAPVPPVVFASNGRAATGIAEASTVVVVSDAEGTVLGSAEADAAGRFSVPLSSTALRSESGADDTLRAVAWDDSGLPSTPTPLVVDAQVPEAPRLDATGGTSVTGAGLERGDTFRVFTADGTPVPGAARLDWGGLVTFTPEEPLNRVDAPYATITDAVGNESDPTEVTFTGRSPDARASSPDAFPTAGSTVSGRLTDVSGGAVMVSGAAGVFLGAARVGSEGAYTVRLATEQAIGDTLSVVSVSAEGAVSRPLALRIGLPHAEISTEPVYQPGVGVSVGPLVHGQGFQPGEAVIAVGGTDVPTVYSADINGNVYAPVNISARAGADSYSVSLVGSFSGEVTGSYTVPAGESPVGGVSVPFAFWAGLVALLMTGLCRVEARVRPRI